MTHRPTQIISGGQTGADQGALRAALDLGISTGGVAPKGYKTETGPNQVLHYVYGLTEGPAGYAARTRANVRDSDATLILSVDEGSPGTITTLMAATVEWRPVLLLSPWDDRAVERIREWLDRVKPRVLNVAGNRESVAPGIGEAVRRLLAEVLA